MNAASLNGEVVLVGQVSLNGLRPSGTKTYLRLLAQGLTKANQKVEIWDLGPREASARLSSRMPNLLHFWLRFAARLITRHPRRAVFHFQRPEELFPLAFLRPSSQIVVTVHGPHWRTVKTKFGHLFAAIHRALFVACLFRADRVVAVSPVLGEELALKFRWLRAKLKTIPPMVDTEYFSPLPKELARARMSIDRTAVVIVYCGRLEREKNLQFLVEAVAELRKSLTEAQLLICGSGLDLEATISKAADLRVPVRAVGDVSPAELRWIYACGDLLAVTSDYEGLPTVVLEALASARPVLCRPLRGVEGLLVPHGALEIASSEKPADFAREARRVLDASSRGALTFPSLDAYSPGNIARKMLQVYSEVSPRARRSAAA